MEPISLRPAQLADAAEIANIHVASWRDAYASILDPEFLSGPVEDDRLTIWTSRLQTPPPNQIVQLAESEAGQIVGFICAYCDHDEQWGTLIDNLHVLPSMRGRRIGELLLNSLVEQLGQGVTRGSLYLRVFEANTSALRFYERLGGKVVGRDRSSTPAAGGKTILRVHWPAAEAIRRQDR